MTKRWRMGVLAMIGTMTIPATALAGGPSPDPEAAAPSAPVEYAPGDRTFYEAPNPIPAGEHGDLVRWQVIESSFTHRYRIMYLSETVAGTPTVVTGLVEAPEDLAPFGGWNLLLFGHGTTGLADICSPSMAIDDDAADGDYAQEFESIGNATSDGLGRCRDRLRGPRRPGLASDARRRERRSQHARRRTAPPASSPASTSATRRRSPASPRAAMPPCGRRSWPPSGRRSNRSSAPSSGRRRANLLPWRRGRHPNRSSAPSPWGSSPARQPSIRRRWPVSARS